MKRKNEHIHVRYNEEKKAKIIKKAKRERTTISEIVTEGLDEYLEKKGK